MTNRQKTKQDNPETAGIDCPHVNQYKKMKMLGKS